MQTDHDLSSEIGDDGRYDLSLKGYCVLIKRFWRFVVPYRSKFFLVFLLIFISVPLSQLALFLTRDVTNQALLATSRTADDRWRTVLSILALQATFWFVSSVLSTVREVLEWYTSMRSTYDLRREFYRHLHALPLGFLNQRPAGEHLYRATIDFGKPDGDGYDPGVMGIITRQFSQLAEQAYSVLWGGIFLYLLNPILALILMVYMVPYTVVGWAMYDRVRRAFFYQRHREELETAVLRDSIAAQRTVKSMGRSTLQRRRYIHAAVKTRRRGMELLWWQTLADNVGLWGVRWVFNGLIAAYASYLVLSGASTIGDWVATVAILTAVQTPLEKFFTIVQAIRRDMVPAQRILETLDVPVEEVEKTKLPVDHVTGDIEFRNVSLSYEKGKLALEDVSFTVKSGESVAFVGPSGAGKSSLLGLILRLYRPISGSVLIDGHDLGSLRLDDFLQFVAVVPQSTYLYDDSIADNIRFGDLLATDLELERAAEVSGVTRFAERHPDRLLTQVGEGSKISGGERQRIGIARAVIRDPRILILDEATANLDPHVESEVLETLRDVSRGRTSLTVAHRLKAVTHCDRIFVLEEGRIVEVGNHDELLALNGLYARLWKGQLEANGAAL